MESTGVQLDSVGEGKGLHAMAIGEDEIEAACEELRQYAKPLCKDENETPLPPFRDINHTIPLMSH